MRVWLADDQMNVRSALRLLLEQEFDLKVVGESAEAAGLLQGVAADGPDLLLLDWELPGLPAGQLIRLLTYERPSLKIIAMSSQPEVEKQAREAGVQTFLNKSEPPERVLSIIQNIRSEVRSNHENHDD